MIATNLNELRIALASQVDRVYPEGTCLDVFNSPRFKMLDFINSNDFAGMHLAVNQIVLENKNQINRLDLKIEEIQEARSKLSYETEEVLNMAMARKGVYVSEEGKLRSKRRELQIENKGLSLISELLINEMEPKKRESNLQEEEEELGGVESTGLIGQELLLFYYYQSYSKNKVMELHGKDSRQYKNYSKGFQKRVDIVGSRGSEVKNVNQLDRFVKVYAFLSEKGKSKMQDDFEALKQNLSEFIGNKDIENYSLTKE